MESRFINGDSIYEMNKLPENSVDLIFADPPYWMRTEGVLHRVEGSEFAGCNDGWDKFNSFEEYETFTKDWLRACHRILKPNGAIWVIGGMQCIYTIGGIMQNLGFWFINDVVWHKKNPTPNFMGTRLNNSHETLIFATKSKNAKFTFNYKTAKELNVDTVLSEEYEKGVRKQLGSVWKIAVCSGQERLKDENGNKLHNTQKPEELLYRIIAISSKINDVVLDPFAGTMTTAAVAKRLGRNFIMIEKDSVYYKYGKERVEKVEFEDGKIARASFDEKPIKVTMSEMIEKGYFILGEDFYLKDGKEKIAKLAKDGKLIWNEEKIDMHTCVARVKNVKAKRLNGFDYWYVKREEKIVSINKIREDYRKMITMLKSEKE